MMEQDMGASDKSDRAFVPSASSPQAVSPVPASIPSAVELVRVWLDHGRASFGSTIPAAALDEVVRSAAEVESLREWKFGASLTLHELREQVGVMRSALKRAQGWLSLLCNERPDTSDAYAVAGAIAAALRFAAQAIEAGTGQTEGLNTGADE
jgi:hypothetical protein